MSGVYESLKVRVQDSFQRGKTPMARVKSSSALSLNGEMDELERLVVDRIGKLKAAVRAGEALVADEAQQANELVENLKVRIAVLEAKAKETEETVKRKDFSREQMEESLGAKIKDLENDLKKKDDELASRDKEINNLKADVDGKTKQIRELESGIEKARQETAGQAKRAEDLDVNSREKIDALDSKLNEAVEVARQKEATIEGLEQKLAAKIQEFDVGMRDKEKSLAWRIAEINDLKSQLKLLTKGIEEMSSFFRQAEALTVAKGQDAGAAAEAMPAAGEKQPPDVQAEVSKDARNGSDVTRQFVSSEILERVTGELAEVTGVMSPLALVIVRQQVAALGESMEKFPKLRLPELLENLAKEISDDNRKIDFRERLARSELMSMN
jgi:chromosome segregation ATPase